MGALQIHPHQVLDYLFGLQWREAIRRGLSAGNFPEKEAEQNRENDEPWRETSAAS